LGSQKAASNARKQGIPFADAVSVLEDDHAITLRDGAYGEEQWVTIAMDAFGRVLVVVYTWRGDSIRIISARAATQGEFRQYMENI
jgi:uncharacterized DUF497 family protein